MGGTVVEAAPGGLLDRLVSADRPRPAPAGEGLPAVRALCLAGAYQLALRTAGPLAEDSPGDPLVTAWRYYAWHSATLGLPDGGGQPWTELRTTDADRPQRIPDHQELGVEAWIVARLLVELREHRANLSPQLRTSTELATLAFQLGAETIGAARARLHRDRPDLVPHLNLLQADLAARAGDDRRCWQAWEEARRGLDDMDDRPGLAAAMLIAGDLLAAPLTSPVGWNCVLASAPVSAQNGLPPQVEALELTGSAGQLARAEAAYEEAAQHYAALEDPAGRGAVSLRRGYLALLAGRTDEAFTLAEQARLESAAAGRSLDAATATIHRALAALADGRLPEDAGAATAVTAAGSEAIGHSPAVGLGLLCVRVGRHWAGKGGQPEQARAAFGLADRIWSGLAEPGLRAQALADTAEVASALGDVPGARVAAAAALDADPEPLAEPPDPMDRRRQRRANLAYGLYNLANRFRDTDGMARALQAVRDTVEPLRPHLDGFDDTGRTIAEALLLLAEPTGAGISQLVYQAREARYRGEYELAAQLFAAAHAAIERSPTAERDADEGIVRAFEGDHEGAAAAYARYTSRVLADIPSVLPSGIPAELLPELVRLQERMIHAQGLAFHLNVSDTARARYHYDALVPTAEPWWFGLGTAWEFLDNEGRLHEQEGDLDAAAASLDRALSELERVRTGLRRDEFKAAFWAGNLVQDIYRDATRIALRRRESAARPPGDPDATRDRAAIAFRYAESARARALLDLMTANSGLATADLPADLVAQWRAASANVTVAADRLAEAVQEHRPDGDEVRAARAQVGLAAAQLDAVQRRLQQHNPRFWTAVNPQADVGDLETIAAALPAGTTLLQYVIGRTDLLAWAVTADGMVAVHRDDSDNDVQRLADAVVRACATGGRYQEPAAILAGKLLHPLREAITASTALLVVPAGPTMRLPFGVLPWEGGTLAEARPLSVLPSAGGVLLAAAAGRDGPDHGAAGNPLVVGDPTGIVYRSSPTGPPLPLPPLPGAGVEAAYVAHLLPGAELLRGDQATEDRVRALIPQAPVVHFATHGVVDPVAPLASAVLLADGESITAAELLGLRLRADLVVLSACHTGTGNLVGGDELLGLGRGLLAAGARSAVVTLWAINDLSGALVMTEFHRRRAGGEQVAEAMRGACQRIRRFSRDEARDAYDALRTAAADAGGQALAETVERAARDLSGSSRTAAPYDHPHHWAPFVLLGTG